jgi:septal ring factor EnvC (AmiA/AmiB activator)
MRPIPTSNQAPWPCDGNDPLVIESGQIKCYRVSATTPAAAAAPVNPPFATNDAAYQRQVAEYEAMLEASIRQNDPSRLSDLRTKSEAIQATLNKMIENLTYLKKETPDIRSERDKLLEKLTRIQQDYSAMLVNTDDLETLRRIRQQENGEAKRLLTIYLMAFLFMSCMLLVYLVYSGRKTPTSPTTAAIPTMSPALT